MFLIITKAYKVLAVRWLCVNHVFAFESLDGGSNDLITNTALVSDVAFRGANIAARHLNSVAFNVMCGVFPCHIIQQPHPYSQAVRLALEQRVFGNSTCY